MTNKGIRSWLEDRMPGQNPLNIRLTDDFNSKK